NHRIRGAKVEAVFVNSNFGKFLVLLVLAITFGSGSARAADWVVLETSDTAAVPERGEIISGDYVFDLQPENQIVVIHRDGTLLRITGPYFGALADHPQLSVPTQPGKDANLGIVSDLLKNKDRLISTLGSTRNPDDVEKPGGDPSAWQPHIGASNTYCIDGDEAIIHRRTSDKLTRVTLVSPNFEILSFLWPAGENALRLDQISDRNHTSYDLLMSDRPGRSKLMIRPATQTENPIEQIAWMAEVGCSLQALLFVEKMLQQTK
ncbi:MAG: hypothetical protein AAGC96_20255, partial [Pseudomonadota bacterium]